MSEEIDFSEKVVVDSEDEHKKQEYSKGIEQFNDPFLSDLFQKVADLLKYVYFYFSIGFLTNSID